MTKPVILLVDDDRAVLEALEAELRPVYEEICRIEACDTPTIALSLLPIWESEDRPVAVAVVDQRMHSMTGVEMIERMRRFTAGRHAAVALLTGYSDLDAVVSAINDGRIQRYFEKPWRPGQFREGLRYLLARHLAETGHDVHRVFRAVATAEELEAIIRIRNEVYRTSPFATVMPASGALSGLDAYDAVSRHFAVFERSGFGERPVGELRIATGEPGPQRDLVEGLVRRKAAASGNLPVVTADSLPCLDVAPDAAIVRQFCTDVRSGGGRVAEPGRLAVVPEARSPAMAYWVFDSTVAVFSNLGIDRAVLACSPPHERFFERLGFRTIAGTSLKCGDNGLLYHHLATSADAMPAAARERVEPLAARYASRGLTCSCETYSECLGSPYVTGDFSGIDLFCPMRAAEVLVAA